jgi:hypothetical protein
MTHPAAQWNVLPHGKLSQIDDNIRTVTGNISVPMKLSRRMTVVRLADSRLVIFSAIALDEDGMTSLEAFGRPAFLIVPSDKHRRDARMWKTRYPLIQVVAPQGARSRVEKQLTVDTTQPVFEDAAVQFVTIPGMGGRESALVVRSGDRYTLVLNDLVGNINGASGLGGWLLRVAGFAGSKPQIPKVVKMSLIKDESALRAQLLEWAELKQLKRILVSHGSPIEDNPQQTLLDLAATLAKGKRVYEPAANT